MKRLFVALTLLLTLYTTAASAAPVFSSGDIKFTGDTYISTLSDTETKGIGRISTISQGDQILWSSGLDGNFINFVFGGYTPVISPTAPIFNFQAVNGFVDFFLTNDNTIFNTSVGVDVATSAIQTGSLLLSTVAQGPTIGIATNVSYSANGFLDVTGGLFSWLLDTNTRPIFDPAGFADLSFGLVGSDNRSNSVSTDYQYIASADMQGSTGVTPVPLPAAIWYMLVGLVFMIGKRPSAVQFS